jgi:lipoprotein-anchoring transpeptidase ErfK/SrfK
MQRVNMKLSAKTGLGTLECVGGSTYECGGKTGFAYPADSTIGSSDKKGDVYTPEYVNENGRPALMQWSVLWIGQRGVYIHSYGELTGSHGCIHLLDDDAESFYNWVKDKTRIVFTWTK